MKPTRGGANWFLPARTLARSERESLDAATRGGNSFACVEYVEQPALTVLCVRCQVAVRPVDHLDAVPIRRASVKSETPAASDQVAYVCRRS